MQQTTITDADSCRIEAVLTFWFRGRALSAPRIERRMGAWFGEDPGFDLEIAREFKDDVAAASAGQCIHWANAPRGRLALILLLDQFRRNIYRGTAAAFARDQAALALCMAGILGNQDQDLAPIEQAFFYMPLQHAESRQAQTKSVALYARLAGTVAPACREIFEGIARFAELHARIIRTFGRFPHRNALLGRESTAEEIEYLAGDAPDFGQRRPASQQRPR